jgi:DNA-nicking Smr family endonuclease
MKRQARPEELQLWARVAETVKPMPGRVVPARPESAAPEVVSTAPVEAATAKKVKGPAPRARGLQPPPSPPPPERLEPGRARRVVRERDPIAARIDLHGLTLDRARPALESFVTAAWSRGDRVVLVITGKGRDGEGLIRRLTPEWLAGPSLRAMIAGVQSAHRRHGGDGAFYVALKAQSNRQTG